MIDEHSAASVIKGMRTYHRLPLGRFAGANGFSYAYITMLERGIRGFKFIDRLAKFAELFGVSFTEFAFLMELEELEMNDPKLVAAMLATHPELRGIILHKRMQAAGLIGKKRKGRK